MNHQALIERLQENRLMRSQQEAIDFDQTLIELAEKELDSADLLGLHLVFDDACEHIEVMWSLVHFVESYEMQDQIDAFFQVLPELVKRAPEWTEILYCRTMNHAIARSMFENTLQSRNDQEMIRQLIASAISA